MEYHKKYQGIDGCVINGPLALALSFAPSLASSEPLFVNVDISDGVSMGKTLSDFYHYWERGANRSVTLSVRASEFFDTFMSRITKLVKEIPFLKEHDSKNQKQEEKELMTLLEFWGFCHNMVN